jgi:hypothetical protein
MYDPYKPSVTDQWDVAAQCALLQERANHEAAQARYWRRRYEALANTRTNS